MDGNPPGKRSALQVAQAGESGNTGDEWNDMALSTTGMGRSRSTQRSTPRPERCWVRPRRGTPRLSSSPSSPISSSTNLAEKKSTSSPTTLSAHKTGQVKEFLEAHPKVQLHFTPTYSSWLNQVELWFSKIERDVIARGVFTSVPDLKRKLMRYIREYNKEPKTVKWKYFDPTRRITPQSAVTVH
jgi:transposase